MSSENNLCAVTLPAAADLSAQQYRCVTVNASGQAAVANATSLVVGILQNNPPSGQAATVAYSGVSKARAGGVIAAGARVTSDASGNVIAAATAGDAVIGVALEGAASGDYIKVLLAQYPFAALA